ncbi:MAG: Com family DNA-binding transcriptional regulator [Candidatus Accumulibacter sp.]|jgi:phage FluMu protein Com|nr:Com family DNA-binding transcriptional regulator [Accumulibacter sp.]
MKEIRGEACFRKLAEGEFIRLAIKCPRCKTLNNLNAESATSAKSVRPPPERHGAPAPERSRRA